MTHNVKSIALLIFSSLLSALIIYYWMHGVDYLQARGSIWSLATMQTVLVAVVVYLLRKKGVTVRLSMLLVLGQIISMVSDWTLGFLIDTERTVVEMSNVSADPLHHGITFIILSSLILLGGPQALAVDGLWRAQQRIFGMRRAGLKR